MRVLGVIPARWASTRLPGKVLVDLGGQPMIQRVWERARRAESLDRLVVATDDDRVEEACRRFGAEVVRTSPLALNGTERVAEAAAGVAAAIVVNVQGDEPLLPPAYVDRAVSALEESEGAELATLGAPLAGAHDAEDPKIAKIVRNARGEALYFSRSVVPHPFRGEAAKGVQPAGWLRHVSVYAYRREALLALVHMRPGPLELREGLEQLRALEGGMRIVVAQVPEAPPSVDTPEDVRRVRDFLASRSATREDGATSPVRV